jgi:hypothetical protein
MADQAISEKIDDIHRHIVPYQFRQFPMTLHQPGGRTKVVQDEEQKKAALAAGWSEQPAGDADDASEKKPARNKKADGEAK